MRNSLLLLFLFLGTCLYGQLLPDENTTTTRAVIFGISKYRDEKISPLNFADKDAEAFAAFLQSTAGGSIPPENIRLRTNDQATSASFFNDMDWLLDVCKDGDKVIIFFSGHGDTEAKTPDQLGFLLPYDSRPHNYLGIGSINLRDLQSVIGGLEAKNVQVVMITDACHSGNLAGSAIGGSGLTTQALAKGFQNTIKILSCQPNELSLEGTQWGGGHAAFTYHLIQGLMGLADENKNDEVTLWEVDKFLSSTVTPEVAPKSQTPFTDGDRTVVLALVDKKTLKQLQKKKEEELPTFDVVDTKGFEMTVIEKASEETKATYGSFVRTLDANQLLEPADDCTDLYYKKLITQPGTESIRNTLTRNFAAALWDSSVDAFNVYIKSDSVRLAEMYKSDPKFSLYPAYLKRASELLDSTHYMYKTLVGTYNYFQGKVKTVEYFETGKPQAVLDEAIASQEKSLEFLEIASSYFELAVANYNNHKIDQAIKYYQKAIDISPTWAQPFDGLGAIYRDMGKYEEAREMYAKALELSPKELLGPAHRNLGYVSYKLKDYAAAESNLKEAIKYRPNDPFIYYYLGALYRDTKRPDDAESAFFKTIQLDKSFGAGFYYLGLVYQDQERYADAQSVLETAVKEDPDNASFIYHLGANYFYQNDFETCMSTMQQVLQLNPSFSDAYYYLAKSLEAMGQAEEAKEAFELAAKKSPEDPEYFYQLGLIQYQQNDFVGADSLLKKSLALDPGNPFTHYYLGMSYYAQKRMKESAVELEKALTLFSDNPDISYQTGLVYYEMKDFANAEPHLQKAITLSPGYGVAYYTLGLLYKSTGRAAESATMLEKAKSLGVE